MPPKPAAKPTAGKAPAPAKPTTAAATKPAATAKPTAAGAKPAPAGKPIAKSTTSTPAPADEDDDDEPMYKMPISTGPSLLDSFADLLQKKPTSNADEVISTPLTADAQNDVEHTTPAEAIDVPVIELPELTEIVRGIAEKMTNKKDKEHLTEFIELVEGLQYDLELLQYEKEEAESNVKKYQSLQKNFEGTGEGGGEEVISALNTQNLQLRELVSKFTQSSEKYKNELKVETENRKKLEDELFNLKSDKQQMQEDINDMKQTIESANKATEMIEELTLQNQDLLFKIDELEKDNKLLESAQETYEELDHTQSLQIDTDKKKIEDLQRTITEYERRIVEKDRLINENKKMIDRLAANSRTQKNEIQSLQQMLNSGSEESKQLEIKVRETSNLKRKLSLLSEELSKMYQQNSLVNIQRFKYQSMYARADFIFGGTSIFLTEAQNLSSEVSYMSTLASGYEACRSLAQIMNGANASRSSPALNALKNAAASSTDIDMPTVDSGIILGVIGKLYLMMLQGLCFAIQANVVLYSDHGRFSDSFAAVVFDLMVNLHMIFDRVGSLANQMASSTNRDEQGELAESLTAFTAIILELEQMLPMDDSRSPAGANEMANTILSACPMLDPCPISTFYNELMQKHMEKEGGDGQVFLAPTLTIAPAFPLVQLEMFYISINSLCDIGIYQAAPISSAVEEIETTEPEVSEAPPSDVDPDAAFAHYGRDGLPLPSSANTPAKQDGLSVPQLIHALLKSIKIEVKASLFNIKRNSSKFAEFFDELKDAYRELLICFSYQGKEKFLQVNLSAEGNSSITVLSHLKAVLSTIRRINSSATTLPCTTKTLTNISVVSDILRFYPFVLMTCVTSFDEEIVAREQYNLFLEKAWNLLVNGSSDILIGSSVPISQNLGFSLADLNAANRSTDSIAEPTPAAVAVSISQLTAGSSNKVEVNWRTRGIELRKVVDNKLSDNQKLQKVKMEGYVTKNQYTIKEQELAEKKNELDTAIKMCDFLREQLSSMHTASAAKVPRHKQSFLASTAESSTSVELPDEILRLKSVIVTLETELHHAVDHTDRLEHEKNHLEDQLAAMHKAAELTHLQMKDARNVNYGRTSFAAESGGTGGGVPSRRRSVVGGGGSMSVPEDGEDNIMRPNQNIGGGMNYELLQKQISYWKQMSLKRISASLQKIPNPSKIVSVNSTDAVAKKPLWSGEFALTSATATEYLDKLSLAMEDDPNKANDVEKIFNALIPPVKEAGLKLSANKTKGTGAIAQALYIDQLLASQEGVKAGGLHVLNMSNSRSIDLDSQLADYRDMYRNLRKVRASSVVIKPVDVDVHTLRQQRKARANNNNRSGLGQTSLVYRIAQ
eukprot:gene7582-10330_t